MKPAFELAQVIERFGKEYQEQYAPNAYVQRTLSALERCRTAAMGGHIDRCDQCGHIRISYNFPQSGTGYAATVIVPSARIHNGKHGSKTESRICFLCLIFTWCSPYRIS